MRDEWKLKGGWSITPKLEGDREYAKYVKHIAEAKKLANSDLYNRPKPVKPDGMSQEEWVLSMQAPSTKAIIEKQKDPDYVRDWSEPLPDNVLANPNAKTKEELVGQRQYDRDAWSHIEAIRVRSKNSIGQSDLPGVSDSRIESAVHHFMVSPPAMLTEDEIDGVKSLTAPVQGVPATTPAYEWKELTPLQAIWHWLRGKKVKSERK